MVRKDQSEILDDPDLPDESVRRAYRDIAAIHRWLGDEHFMVRAIRRDPLPVHRILDVGCATGIVLRRVGRKLGVEGVGADILPRPAIAVGVPIVRADARFDPLPVADVAYSMYLGHHLSADDLILLIRNVGRYSRRFILLDLVRHPLPLVLFRMFVAPLICRIDAEDGRRSIRRSYTAGELREITTAALDGSVGTFRQTTSPLYMRQVVDISYDGSTPAVESRRKAAMEVGAWVR